MGFSTLSLISLASCIAVQSIVLSGLPQMKTDAAGRVVRGVRAGVGFIGAGAVLHGAGGRQVQGLATAASIWVSAALGAAAVPAIWPLIAIGGGHHQHRRSRADRAEPNRARRHRSDPHVPQLLA